MLRFISVRDDMTSYLDTWHGIMSVDIFFTGMKENLNLERLIEQLVTVKLYCTAVV